MGKGWEMSLQTGVKGRGFNQEHVSEMKRRPVRRDQKHRRGKCSHH